MEKEKSDSTALYLTVINFMMLFYGLRLAVEEYLYEDELPLSRILLIAFFSGLIVAAIAYFLKNSSKKNTNHNCNCYSYTNGNDQCLSEIYLSIKTYDKTTSLTRLALYMQ